MSENINFIPATELPVAEGKEVSVLCLENGAMKQKPGASLGGGEKADMVIALTAPFNHNEPNGNNTTVTIESGSLEAVAAALADGRPPVVKCKRYHVTNGFDTSYPIIEGGVYDCDVYYYGSYVISSCSIGPYVIRIGMSVDDHDYLEVWCYPLSATRYQVI